MASINYESPTNETTLLSTELNALATDTLVNGTTILDNSTNRDIYGIAELDLGASTDLSAQTNSTCYLYLIPSYDGTNYADNADETDEEIAGVYMVGTFSFTQKTDSQRAIIEGISLSPVKYKAVLQNSLGVALNATGNTVKIKTYALESN
jgi:hypothetical protein